MRRTTSVALATVISLVVAAPAQAHTLTKNRARNAVIDSLRAAERENPAQFNALGVGPAASSCKQFSAHKVACLARFQIDPAPADPNVAVLNCSRRVMVTMSSRSSALKPRRFFGGGCA